LPGYARQDRLDKAIVERQAKLKTRLEKLARLHEFTPYRTQRGKIEAFVRRVRVQEKQVGALMKANAVKHQKISAMLDRDKGDTGPAFIRLLAHANEAMERYGKAATLHMITLDKLIAEADKILKSA